MLNFMKYEIKGSIRYIGIIFITMILLSTFVLTTADINNVPRTIILSAIGLIGGSIAILIHFVNSFSKEVYEDRGYLTLTLPISGDKIVLSKLLVTLLWYGIYSIIQFTFVYFILNKYSQILEQPVFTTMLSYGKEFLMSPEIILLVILSIFQLILFIMTVYFSIAISKAALGIKKVGKLIAFILFLLLNTGISYLNVFIERVLPFGVKFDIGSFSEKSMNLLVLTFHL